MQNLLNRLKKLEESNRFINVYIIGMGFMGTSLFSQLQTIKGIRCNIASSRRCDSVIKAYEKCKIDKNNIKEFTNNYNYDDYFISKDIYKPIYLDEIDVVVDATGNSYEGAKIALTAIENKKHLVSFNVETESIVGPILSKMAKENGVCYTGIAGDEPGSIKELYDFCDLLGLEVLAIGKGKNNPLIPDANYETVNTKDKTDLLNSKMLATFVDGSKTMIELTSVSNATGFIPDIDGCHGIESDIKDLAKKLSLKEEGGILDKYGVVEYVRGIAPGVFVMVRGQNEIIDSELKFLKIGEGPNYVLYRPYHLTSIEAPITIARAFFYNEPTIAPLCDTPFSDTVSVAKRDLKAGEYLDFPGGKTVYGEITTFKNSRANNLLPYGLLKDDVKVIRDVKKGERLTYDDVLLNESELLTLRKKIEKSVD